MKNPLKKDDEYTTKLKAEARRLATNDVKGMFHEPSAQVGQGGAHGHHMRTHKAMYAIMKKLGLTMSDVNKIYNDDVEAKIEKRAAEHFKVRSERDREMIRRSDFVRGALMSALQPEYQGKRVGWDHKIVSPHPEHDGYSFKPKAFLDGDLSSYWIEDDPDKTKAALIDRFLDEDWEKSFFVWGGDDSKGWGADRKSGPRWNPKIKLRLRL